MKHILLTICLLSGVALASYGQSTMNRSSAAATAGVTVNISENSKDEIPREKLLLSSKINEMDGALARKAQNRAQEIYTDINDVMLQEMKKNNDGTADGATKGAEQKRLYKDITILSADMLQNRMALKEKLDMFLNTL